MRGREEQDVPPVESRFHGTGEDDDDLREIREREREFECRVLLSSPSLFFNQRKKRKQLTGDSEPVKRIRDFQIISADVMIRPGWR